MTATVWVIDDDHAIRWVLDKALEQADLTPRCFDNADDPLNALDAGEPGPDVLISDVRMPGTDGLRLLRTVQRRYPDIPVIIMTAHSDLESAVASYQGGAFEYLPKPFDVDEAVALVRRAVRYRRNRDGEPTAAVAAPPPTDIIGEAPAMQEVFRAIGRLAHSPVTVLINGQSGTGKELVARALHRHSVRSDGPFVALNMAAIPKDLIESELFGHEKGAFTNANAQRLGRFEQAHGGTLFLDEIGDMPAEAQTRLLRVLQESEFYRVGGTQAIRVDVRIIAATHQDLEQKVQRGEFREDLFHRLNVIRIHLPRLAERREDIPRLAQHFLQQAARELGMEVKSLHPDAAAFLSSLPWPGNVRQLENTCRWLTVMASGRQVLVDDLPPELVPVAPADTGGGGWERPLKRWAERALMQGEQGLLAHAVPTFERTLLEVALAHTGGRRGEAAELLGWGRNTLTRKLKELQLDALAADED